MVPASALDHGSVLNVPRRVSLAWAVVVGTVALGQPAAAGAVTTCQFDAGSGLMTVTSSTTSTLTIDRNDSSLRLDGTACEAATVTNTDTITITTPAGSHVVLDLGGGRLEPGMTDEGDGSSEIEVEVSFAGGTGAVDVIGTDEEDHFDLEQTEVASTRVNAYNLNVDETSADFDVTFPDGPGAGAALGTEGGDDVLEVGVLGPMPFAVDVLGGSGSDTVSFAANGGSVNGFAGLDTLDESFTTEPLIATSGTAVNPGVLVIGDLDPVELVNLPRVIGGSGPDVLTGIGFTDLLLGGPGPDTLIGLDGRDRLEGGRGIDLIRGGVDADTLIGGGQRDRLFGGAGGDGIDGGGGDDRLLGEEGRDDLFGGRGTDFCDGGPGRPDIAHRCESVVGVP